MLEEFKKFAMRGNVVDMAVGIIIGAHCCAGFDPAPFLPTSAAAGGPCR